jgi:hypothetical protein
MVVAAVTIGVTVGVLVPLQFFFGDRARERRRLRKVEREQKQRAHGSVETTPTR